MSWTDERVELLKKLWNQGLSASQIAAELGGGVTRNAVIGKVHRLGLSGRAKAPAPAAARTRKATRAPSHPMSHAPTTSVRGNLALSAKPAASPQAMVYIAPAPRPEIEVVVPMSERVTIAGFPFLRREIPDRHALLRLPLPDRVSAVDGSSEESGYAAHVIWFW
jgi:GcrA cell cycle regulator